MPTYMIGNKIIPNIRLVNGGPEFEVIPKAPTYEQAIVHMYREAKSIVEQGERLAGSLRWHKGAMRDIRRHIDNWRGQLSHYAAGPIHRRAVKELADLYRLHVEHLDILWEAQEKYNAWAKLYGDIL